MKPLTTLTAALNLWAPRGVAAELGDFNQAVASGVMRRPELQLRLALRSSYAIINENFGIKFSGEITQETVSRAALPVGSSMSENVSRAYESRSARKWWHNRQELK
jgi:hypothetical protein